MASRSRHGKLASVAAGLRTCSSTKQKNEYLEYKDSEDINTK